jgi:hypothetical protein
VPEEHEEKDFGQCKQSGVTEEHEEKEFGSMQALCCDRKSK